MNRFPGQEARITLGLEQMRCLSSRIRAEVFWTFTGTEALSAREVAEALSKSPQTVHFHVKSLMKASLLIEVGTRIKRSRVERLYAHSARAMYDLGAAGDGTYNAACLRGFRLSLLDLIRETELYYERLEADAVAAQFSFYLRETMSLDADQVQLLRRRIQEAVAEVQSQPSSGQAAQLNLMFYGRPTKKQAREWEFGVDEDTEDIEIPESNDVG